MLLWNINNEQFSAIFSSPLSRALDTAKMIQRGLSTPCPREIVIDPLLMELNMGSMEQISWNIPFQIHTRDTAFPKGGESLNDVLKRALLAVDLLLLFSNNKNNHKQEEEEHILLVSHGMFLTELVHALCICYESPWIDLAWSNTGITTIEINIKQEEKERIRFLCINDTQHLFFKD